MTRIDVIVCVSMFGVMFAMFFAALGAHNACITEPAQAVQRFCMHQGGNSALCRNVMTGGW